MRSDPIKTLVWHDGVLMGCQFVGRPREQVRFDLKVALYGDHERATRREPITVQCRDASDVSIRCDAGALADNRIAGNIVDAREESGVLILRLTGGVLKVTAKSFKVWRRSAARRTLSKARRDGRRRRRTRS
jgi:hypothetical protein